MTVSLSLLTMVERPTAFWRAHVAHDLAGLAAGTLDPDEAVAVQPFPDDMIRDTDEVLDHFEADIAGLLDHRHELVGDAEIFEVIEQAVKALNAVNARYDRAAFETVERDLLCAHMADVLDDARHRRGRARQSSPDDVLRDHRRMTRVVTVLSGLTLHRGA